MGNMNQLRRDSVIKNPYKKGHKVTVYVHKKNGTYHVPKIGQDHPNKNHSVSDYDLQQGFYSTTSPKSLDKHIKGLFKWAAGKEPKIRKKVNEATDYNKVRPTRKPDTKPNGNNKTMSLGDAEKSIEKQFKTKDFAKRWNLKSESVNLDEVSDDYRHAYLKKAMDQSDMAKYKAKRADKLTGTAKTASSVKRANKVSKGNWDLHMKREKGISKALRHKVSEESVNEAAGRLVYKHPVTGKTKRFPNTILGKERGMAFKKSPAPDKKLSKTVQNATKLNKLFNEIERRVGATYPDGDPFDVVQMMIKNNKNYTWDDVNAALKKHKMESLYDFYDNMRSSLGEGVKTNNIGRGYHGYAVDTTKSDAEADIKYAKTHSNVKKHTGADDKAVRDYLDSTHGRHLPGRENNSSYIKKDFHKFRKTYSADQYESVKSDDKKPEAYTDSKGKRRWRMVAVDQDIMKEGLTEGKVASIKSTDGLGNTHYIHHYDNGAISSHNNRSKQELSLSNHAFNHRGGTAERKAAVRSLVKGAKNSSDLAKKINDSKIGKTNWEPVKEDTLDEFKTQIKHGGNEPYKQTIKVKKGDKEVSINKSVWRAYQTMGYRRMDEENINELKQNTLKSYLKKSKKDQSKQYNTAADNFEKAKESDYDSPKFKKFASKYKKAERKYDNRIVGQSLAKKKIKEETLDEISTDLAKRYVKGAHKDQQRLDKVRYKNQEKSMKADEKDDITTAMKYHKKSQDAMDKIEKRGDSIWRANSIIKKGHKKYYNHLRSESVEDISEISQELRKRYTTAAKKDLKARGKRVDKHFANYLKKQPEPFVGRNPQADRDYEKYKRKVSKDNKKMVDRGTGLERAKYNYESVEESSGQIDEISQGMKNRYIKRAAMDAAVSANDHGKHQATPVDNWDKQKDAKKKVMKRLKGIELATSEGTQDPKLAAQLAARKAQRAKNKQRAAVAAARKKAAAEKPKIKRAPRKVKSDIRDASDRNIIMQLRKAQDVGGNHEIEFRRGKGKLDKKHIDTILKVHDGLTKNDHKRLLRIKVHQNPEQAKKIAVNLGKKFGIK